MKFGVMSLMDVPKYLTYSVPCGIKLCQQFCIDELLYVINHQIHNGFGHKVPTSLGDNFHV